VVVQRRLISADIVLEAKNVKGQMALAFMDDEVSGKS
jgi:hypothetical protein